VPPQSAHSVWDVRVSIDCDKTLIVSRRAGAVVGIGRKLLGVSRPSQSGSDLSQFIRYHCRCSAQTIDRLLCIFFMQVDRDCAIPHLKGD
jgi:hypothetical protein